MTESRPTATTVRTMARKLWKLALKAVFWRIPGFAFWFWLLAVVGRSTEEPLVSYCWILCLLPFVGQMLGKFRRLVVVFPVYLPVYYFGIFPVAVITDSLSVGAKVSRWLLKATRQVGKWTNSALFLALAGFIYGGLLVALSLTRNPQVLWTLAWASLAWGGIFIFSLGVRWAVRPFALPNVIIGGSLWGIRVWASISANFEISEEKTRRKIETAGTWLKTALLADEHESGISAAVRHLCVPVSLTALAFLFISLSLSFGFSYYALWASSSTFIASSPIEAPSLPIALYYAISVGVTAPSAVLAPVDWPAFLMQGLQHSASVLMIALVPAALFFSLSARHSEYMSGAKERIDKTRDFLLGLWDESRKREAATKKEPRRENREKPNSLAESLYRLGVLLGEASGSGSAGDKPTTSLEKPSESDGK